MTAVKKIIRSIAENPDQWQIGYGAYTLDHKSGLEIWIANAPFWYGVYRPQETRFNVLDKIRFALALRRWKAKQPKRVPKPKLTLDDCAALLDQVEA